MKGNVSDEWDWLVRVEEKDLLLEKALTNGEMHAEGEVFADGDVEKPVIVA